MLKKIQFITQAKGGSGKSVLTFMLAEKYRNAVLFDLDHATTTTIKQLAYRNPIHFSFVDPSTKRIDRSAFNELFKVVAETNLELYIADLGAGVAQQLPQYFAVNGIEVVEEALRKSNIHLKVICVVGGGNIFKATMEYLQELVESTKRKVEIVVAHNGFYPCSAEEQKILVDYTTRNKLHLVYFDLVKDKGETALRIVENVLESGKGIEGLSPFTSIYFKKPIADLNL